VGWLAELAATLGTEVKPGADQAVQVVVGVGEAARCRPSTLVNTPWVGKRDTFVPLGEATFEGGTLSVPYRLEQLQGAPMIDPDGALEDWEEAKLYSHYGIPHPGKAGLRMTRYYDLFPNRRQCPVREQLAGRRRCCSWLWPPSSSRSSGGSHPAVARRL